jgi:hypothetical protein
MLLSKQGETRKWKLILLYTSCIEEFHVRYPDPMDIHYQVYQCIKIIVPNLMESVSIIKCQVNP